MESSEVCVGARSRRWQGQAPRSTLDDMLVYVPRLELPAGTALLSDRRRLAGGVEDYL